ncbi:MAG: dethiobiotin synthase [Pseudomonadota bacterium]
MSGFFVSGTDTEVGKTFVSAALLHASASYGFSTLGLKPVAAGCDRTEHGLRNEDALALMAASTEKIDYHKVNPIPLEPAIAPHIAAAEAGTKLSASALAAHCREILDPEHFTLVEGAGGWLVPLNLDETLADFAVHLQLPVILVVGLKLGCINHALLSAQSIGSSGLQLAAWVANAGPTSMQRQMENVATLEALLSAPCLGQIPWLGVSANPAQAAPMLDFHKLLSRVET